MLNFKHILQQTGITGVQQLYDHFADKGWESWVDEYQKDSYGYLGQVTCQNYWGFQFALDFTEDIYPQEYDFSNLPETRVIVAYGISNEKADGVHRKRMKRYLGNSGKVYAHFGPGYTKGHFIANRMGGAIDINLYPQIGHINMGRSTAGKRYVAMEKYVWNNPGTFVFCRPIYKDFSVRPYEIEYGYCDSSMNWAIETFTNLAPTKKTNN
jgi:hypothetical protein